MTDPIVIGSGVFCIIGLASTATGVGATWGVPIGAVACPTFTSTVAWTLFVDLVKNSVQKFETNQVQREKLLFLTNMADMTHTIGTLSYTIATSSKSGHNIFSYAWDTYQGKNAGIKILGKVAEASSAVIGTSTIKEPKIEMINDTSFVCTFDVPVSNYSSYQGLTEERHLISIGMSVKNSIPVDGLMAHYPFNGNANDESGNGHNGTVNGATLTSDRFGNQNKAYSFNGSNTFIEIRNSSNLNLKPGGFTLLAWVNYTDYNTNGVVIAKHLFTHGTGYGLSAVENKALFYLDGGGANGIRTMETYADGNWHLFIATYNETTMSLYVDGSLKISKPTIYNQTNNSNICIGNSWMYGGGYSGYFKGKIDDVRIYNRRLTEEEIQLRFHEGGWK